MSQQVQAQAFDEFAHAAEVAYREAEEKDATLCSVCRCQQVAIDAPAASNLFAVSRNLETLTHDRDELRRQNEQLAHQLDEMHHRLITENARLEAEKAAAVAGAETRMQRLVDQRTAERDGRLGELETTRRMHSELQVQYAELRNSAEEEREKLRRSLNQEVHLAEVAAQHEREERELQEQVTAQAVKERDVAEEHARQLRLELQKQQLALAKLQKEYDEVPKLGEVVAAVRASAKETASIVEAEGARISNERPRIRAVKLVQAQRDALKDAEAASAEWSDVRDHALSMKLELSRQEREIARQQQEAAQAGLTAANAKGKRRTMFIYACNLARTVIAVAYA